MPICIIHADACIVSKETHFASHEPWQVVGHVTRMEKYIPCQHKYGIRMTIAF